MNKKEIQELFDYMTTSGKSTFVDDFSGWGDASKVPGYTSFASMEGNGLKSEHTGEKYEPQCESVRKGNHLEIQYREYGDLAKHFKLGDLFPSELPIVIVTGGEALRKISPIFQRRSELIEWLMQVHCYCEQRQTAGNPVPWYWEGNMYDLAVFLYKNHPNKIEDESIYDRLTKV